MCTLVILRQPHHSLPLVVAANRDERLSRPALPPGGHWPNRAVVAGKDLLAGGTWLGINKAGFVVAILNREGQLGPQPGKMSRGELALELLCADSVRSALTLMRDTKAAQYCAFNAVIADTQQAVWLSWNGSKLCTNAIVAGVHMLASGDLNADRHGRVAYYLPRWRAAPLPQENSWGKWPSLLASTEHSPEDTALGAMCIRTEFDYGTVSSSLVGLHANGKIRWDYAPGPPDETEFEPINLG